MSSSSSFSVKQEIRKLGETTTVRGIPRAVKSTYLGLRLIWIVVVLICVAMLIYQTTTVLTRYFKYGSTTLLSEGQEKSVFPDITICNLNPLTILNKTDYSLFRENVLAALENWTCEELDEGLNNLLPYEYCRKYKELYDSSPQGYIASKPMVDNSPNNSLFAACKFWDWDGKRQTFECTDNIRRTWNYNYYNCYTLKVSDTEDYYQDVLGVTVTIFLNDLSPTIKDAYFWTPDRPDAIYNSLSTGARVAVHKRGALPDMSRSIMVGPGSETTVLLSATQRKRLPSPFPSQCTNQQLLNGSRDYTYTAEDCVQVCLQDAVVNTCGCIAGKYPFTADQLEATNYTLCGNMTSPDGDSNDTLDVFKAIKGLHCIDYYAHWVIDDIEDGWRISCKKKCHLPCNEFQYDMQISTLATWPDISYELAFYATTIYDQTYADKFSGYQQIIDDYITGMMTENDTLDALDKLRNLDLIRRNFLQLNVLFDRMYPYVITDQPTMTSDNLLAQLGGVLSLWLGITVMTAVELVEFIYTLCARWREARKIINVLPSPVTSQEDLIK